MSSTVSTAQLITASALVATSLGIGYAIGRSSHAPAAATQITRTGPASEAAATTADQKAAEEDESDSDSEAEDIADGDLGAVKPGMFEQCKLVLVVRTDLKMSSGKIAAQCGHATLACYKALSKTNPGLLRHWERTGQAKVALKANDEDELVELEAIAKSLNICARPIFDAGRTQIAAGSRTVLGIGPAPVELVNKVTGKLRLL